VGLAFHRVTMTGIKSLGHIQVLLNCSVVVYHNCLFAATDCVEVVE